jgi:hypothetical protein
LIFCVVHFNVPLSDLLKAQQLSLPHCVVITQLPFVARCTKLLAQL